MNTIEVSDMNVATAIQPGDLFIIQRKISDTPVPFSVPSSLLLVSGGDLSEETVSWTGGATAPQTTPVADIAQKMSFFTVSDGRLCINRSMLSTTPTMDGELYDNNGVLTIHHGG